MSDVVATLSVLADPTAGDALGRLLTGARWRIGPRDLAALEARARALVHSRRPPRPAADGAPTPRPRRRPSAAASSRRSTTSAARTPTRPPATAGCGGSAAELATCAPGSSESLPDLVDEVARTLGLETELASAPGEPGRRAGPPRRAARGRRRVHRAGRAALAAGFLGYLRDAEERERGLEPGEVAVNPEAVQLLTGHAAKGLEWDVVAVPGMTKDQFPAKADTSDSWIKDPGAVPAELRLTDREELPRLRLPVPGSATRPP